MDLTRERHAADYGSGDIGVILVREKVERGFASCDRRPRSWWPAEGAESQSPPIAPSKAVAMRRGQKSCRLVPRLGRTDRRAANSPLATCCAMDDRLARSRLLRTRRGYESALYRTGS